MYPDRLAGCGHGRAACPARVEKTFKGLPGVSSAEAKVLELSSRRRLVIFDKTGKLTRGEPAVTDMVPGGWFAAGEVLKLAAGAEKTSKHPLGRA